MRSLKGFAVVLVLLTSYPILAQQAAADASQNASASAGGASVNESAAASAGFSAPMQPVSGELVGKLDSKTAKVGDAVVVKTTQSVHGAAGVVIPKGSRLVGRVTDVRAHAKGSEDGYLAVQFDRAELKGGQTLEIHSIIQSIAPSASAVEASSMDTEEPLGGLAGGGGVRGGGRAAGGLTGGALSAGSSLAGNTSGALGSTAGSPGLTSAGGGALGAAGGLQTAAGGLQTAAGGSAALGAHATAIPGVMLAGDATGATSGALSASRKNVRLDSGTQIVFGLATAINR